MAVIRPFNPPVVTPRTPAQAPAAPRATADAKAAQRAFFQQALGDATPVRAAPQAAAPSHGQSPQRVAEIRRAIPDEPPARPMRPGSFIDIKV